MAIKSLESTGYSDRIAGEETRYCAAIKSLGVDANQMDTAIESLVDRDVTAAVHGCCMADVWLMYGCCKAVLCLLYVCCMSAVSCFDDLFSNAHCGHNSRVSKSVA